MKLQKVRTVWISDLHIGSWGCKANEIVDFLKHYDMDFLYLVGDIVDGYKLKRSWFWPDTHNTVVQKILRKARKGTKVFYVFGNHDEFMKKFSDHSFGDIDIAEKFIHETVKGKRLVVIHGHQADLIVLNVPWLAVVGSVGYELMSQLNSLVDWARLLMGLQPWSLAGYIKAKVKRACVHIERFEVAMSEIAKSYGADGVVCGHIHSASSRNIAGIDYLNCGDWTESCTAIVEDSDGNIKSVKWRSGAELA